LIGRVTCGDGWRALLKQQPCQIELALSINDLDGKSGLMRRRPRQAGRCRLWAPQLAAGRTDLSMPPVHRPRSMKALTALSETIGLTTAAATSLIDRLDFLKKTSGVLAEDPGSASHVGRNLCGCEVGMRS